MTGSRGAATAQSEAPVVGTLKPKYITSRRDIRWARRSYWEAVPCELSGDQGYPWEPIGTLPMDRSTQRGIARTGITGDTAR